MLSNCSGYYKRQCASTLAVGCCFRDLLCRRLYSCAVDSRRLSLGKFKYGAAARNIGVALTGVLSEMAGLQRQRLRSQSIPNGPKICCAPCTSKPQHSVQTSRG